MCMCVCVCVCVCVFVLDSSLGMGGIWHGGDGSSGFMICLEATRLPLQLRRLAVWSAVYGFMGARTYSVERVAS